MEKNLQKISTGPDAIFRIRFSDSVTEMQESSIVDASPRRGLPASVSALGLHMGAQVLALGVVAPIDRWRLLLQLQPTVNPSARNVLLNGYRGIIPSISCSALASVTHIGIVAAMGFSDVNKSAVNQYAPYVLTGTLTTAISYPLDVRYTTRAASATIEPTPYRLHLLTGLPLALMAVPVSVAVALSTLSFLSLVFPVPNPDREASELDFARGVAVGCTAALAGSVATYPLDTLRRRMVVGASFADAYRVGSLLRGLPLHVAKAIPQCAILTYGYMCNLRYFSFVRDLGDNS